MDLRTKIAQATKQAMKEKDATRLSTLRLINAAIKDRDIATRGEGAETGVGDAEVRIDGDLATVWIPFAFYLGEDFSHCGINAVQLARLDARWQIIHIADTRRRTNCDPSIP